MMKLPLSAVTAFLLNTEMAFAENAGTTRPTTGPDIHLGALRCAVSS